LLFATHLCLQIDWDNRKIGDIGNDCLVSVDGVDCQVKGRINFDGTPDLGCKSQKHQTGGALRYEVAIAIRSSCIVWIAGPHLPGNFNDLQIFRQSGLIEQLEENERVEADDGCIAEAPRYVKCPGSVYINEEQRRLRGRVRMHHESINERLKNWGILSKKFRGENAEHAAAFRAVAAITQLAMDDGEELLMDVPEHDDDLTDADILAQFGV